jgi:hypothetical protein
VRGVRGFRVDRKRTRRKRCGQESDDQHGAQAGRGDPRAASSRFFVARLHDCGC